MIASLRGTVERIMIDSVLIETGGVGYQVFATPDTLAELSVGREGMLWTELVVREDSLTLYGFTDGEQQEFFLLLQKVSGIGPRMALTILSVLKPSDLSQALRHSDSATLQRVPGVGKRVAERLIVELKDKVPDVAGGPSFGGSAVTGGPAAQVKEALTSLGFSVVEAEQAISRAMSEAPDAPPGTVLRIALTQLGGRR